MTMNDTLDPEERPMRVTFLGAVALIALFVYLGFGVAYAVTRPDAIAGMVGAAHVVGLVTQVVAWPVWAFGLV